MRLRYYKRRTVYVDYAATINFTVPPECDTLRIGTLTGALALNIIDPNGKDGDYLKILVMADASARVITIGGAQGAPGTVNLGANAVACFWIIFHEGIGKYASVVAPG